MSERERERERLDKIPGQIKKGATTRYDQLASLTTTNDQLLGYSIR